MGRDLTNHEKTELERLVDTASLQGVLVALAEICSEKADHVQASYNDAELAQKWRSAESAITRTLHRTEHL